MVKYSSSRSIISKSKWFVGSSSIKKSGSPSKTFAKQILLCSHHDKSPILWSKNCSRFSCEIILLTLTSWSRAFCLSIWSSKKCNLSLSASGSSTRFSYSCNNLPSASLHKKIASHTLISSGISLICDKKPSFIFL